MGDGGGRRFRTALLVEDDPAQRRAIARWLAKWAERTITAGSVRSALRALANAQPDLLVLDLGLPDGRGTDVAAAAAAAAAPISGHGRRQR